jgi:pimeloyl-ACP methyl ester carboxylesterase
MRPNLVLVAPFLALTVSAPPSAAAAEPPIQEQRHEQKEGSSKDHAFLHATKHVYGPAPETLTLIDGAGKNLRIAPKDLAGHTLEPGRYTIQFFAKGEAVELPPCNTRGKVTVDGRERPAPNAGPLVFAIAPEKDHDVRFEVNVSDYERRIACGHPPRTGLSVESHEELRLLSFATPNAGHCKGPGCTPGQAVIFEPRAHDERKPSAVLVGAHPWNGTVWTYAAYTELLQQAQEKDVVLLFPSGLGNSLYTAPAENEVMRALDALAGAMAVDPARVSLFGASMGGQGATTIGFHRPDRFSAVTSLFGDAKFDLSTYVKTLLPNEDAAHRVNPLDAIENARHLPVWLIHGTQDTTSPIVQSELLYAAMSERGYKVKFDRDPKFGHNGGLLAKHAASIVDLAATAKTPAHPTRVSYKSLRSEDTGAYGVRLVRERATGDALIDVEYVLGKIKLRAASNVKEIVIRRGSFGLPKDQEPELVPDGPLPPLKLTWES